jgi:hypothetical protein
MLLGISAIPSFGQGFYLTSGGAAGPRLDVLNGGESEVEFISRFAVIPTHMKAADVIALYMDPPQYAAVFCVDQKMAIQGLDRLVHILSI